MKDFLSQAAKLLKEQKQYRRRVVVFLCLAVIVGYGTVMALKLYGQAMTHKVDVLDCGYKVHEHTDECYKLDEEGNRIGEPVCGYADYVIHVHNDLCYGKNGNLDCTLEEHEPHEHTAECYVTERVLVCGERAEGGDAEAPESTADSVEEPDNNGTAAENDEGAAGDAEQTSDTAMPEGAEPQQDEIVCGKEIHSHDENCYENVLSCGYAEEHTHNADCIVHELNCEMAEHTHGEGCFDEEGNAVCGMEEHSHEIGCYDEEGNTLCNTADHVHDESCLNAEGKIACGPEGHEHIVGCYRNYYGCGKEAHIHSESCYTRNLICGMEEHEHEEVCFAPAASAEPAAGAAEPEGAAAEEGSDTAPEGAEAEGIDASEGTAAPEGGETTGHVHTDDCYEEVTRLVCGEMELHTHDDSCYTEDCFDEEGNLLEGSRVSCGLLQLEEHTHSEACIKTVELTPEEVAALNNGAKIHIHEDSCYDGEGNLICGHEETHIHGLECYDEAGKLICDYGKETTYYCGKEEHTHNEECLDEEGGLTCGLEEHTHDEGCQEEPEAVYYCGKEGHVHAESCYNEDGELICELEEHTHEESCQKEPETMYYCGKEEHAHGEECFDEDGNLACELEEHTHNAVCLVEEPMFYCGKEEHVHGEACFDENANLICELEEHIHDGICLVEEPVFYCGKEEHTHGEGCYDEAGNLSCELEEHTHDESCLEEPVYYCGKEEHSHGDGCYDENGSLTCESEEHTHNAICLIEDPFFYCGLEEHIHGKECYNAEGNLTCEMEEHAHDEGCLVPDIILTDEGEDYVITVTASQKAFPDAEGELTLLVTRLEESEEEYQTAQRLVQENTESGEETELPFEIEKEDGETVSKIESDKTHNIFDIRVLLDGVEIQPQRPVKVTFEVKEKQNGTEEPEGSDESEESSAIGSTESGASDGRTIDTSDAEESTDGEQESSEQSGNPQVFHVDTEKGTVEDMNAVQDEEGKTVINTPHFSVYDFVTDGGKPEGITETEPWLMLTRMFYNNDNFDKYAVEENGGKIIKVKLTEDIQVPAYDESDSLKYTVWLDCNRALELDLNGHKIICENDTKQGYLFKVGGNGNAGRLIIKDSSAGPTCSTEEVGGLKGQTPNESAYGEPGIPLGSYAENECIYYNTTSSVNGDGMTTNETTMKYTVNFSESGAIINKSSNINSLILMGNGGEMQLDGGCLTNLYGNAVKVAGESGSVVTGIKIDLQKGYLVGNGSRGMPDADDKGGAISLSYFDGQLKVGSGIVFAANKGKRGGAIYSKGNDGTITAKVSIEEGSVISSNRAEDNGGGIYAQDTELVLNGGSITNNVLKNSLSEGGQGGGIALAYSKMDMNGGTIAANMAGGGGGGIYISNSHAAGIAPYALKMRGGIVTGNWALHEGGGIRLDIGYAEVGDKSESAAPIYITKNGTLGGGDWGGGGIFIADGGGVMKIYDSIITGNEAGGFGGGVGGCSTGRIIALDAEHGAAVYGNSASGTQMSGNGSSKHEDHVASKDDTFMAGSNFQDVFSALGSQVNLKMLGGGLAQWIGSCDYKAVAYGKEVESGAIVSTRMLGLTARPDAEDKQKAEEKAKVFINGNKSGTHGGGMMCNGVLWLGDSEVIEMGIGLTIDIEKVFETLDKEPIAFNKGDFSFILTEVSVDDVESTKEPIIISNQVPESTGHAKAQFVLPYKCEGWNFPAEEGQVKEKKYVYRLEEIMEEDAESATTTYDSTVYTIEVTVKGKIKKEFINGTQVTRKYLYLEEDSVQVFTGEGEGKVLKTDGVAKSYFGDYDGSTSTHGPQMTISNAFTNVGTEINAFGIKKLNSKTEELIQDVEFYLTEIDETGKTIGEPIKGDTGDAGMFSYAIPAKEDKRYLLTEDIRDGYEEAGPWIVVVTRKGAIKIVEAEVIEIDGEGTKSYQYEETTRKLEREQNSADNLFYFKVYNTPILYALPETGGSGTILYTMAGGMIVLLGAGFLYKKKFRERRV